jgi:DNA-binding LytR/AlgR family response regulator
MINIIVCDDHDSFRRKVIDQITKYMDKLDHEYKILEFNDYDSKFINTIKSDITNIIYVLDIETPTRSGIDVARIIRKDDLESPIIFLTGHEELGNLVLARNTNILSFINKFDSFSNRLNNALNIALKLLNKRHMLRFNDRGSIYSIECDKILYITTDTVARKTIIVTDKREHRVNNPLSFFLENLNDDFCQSHKSCIINKSRVSNLNNNNNTILFDNGTTIDLLSNKYKKEIDLNA